MMKAAVPSSIIWGREKTAWLTSPFGVGGGQNAVAIGVFEVVFEFLSIHRIPSLVISEITEY